LKDQWIGENVNLYLLSQRIKGFFTERRFETEVETTADRYRIDAAPDDPRVPFRIRVNLFGRPNDFTIEFIPNKKTRGFASRAMILGYILAFFGGGGLVLRDAKLQEATNRLEHLFWTHVDSSVAALTNSAEAAPQEERGRLPSERQ
jgi:hypothetical protein